MKKKSIFISHATPEDNEFARWLSLQLIALGYDVWCDVINLKGGEDFWVEIENEIRNNSVKFFYVLSSNSNNREGTLKELTVAQKTKKGLTPEDPHFIIPLHIDKNLSYDDINIDLVRLNSINFKTSWRSGLLNLIAKLDDDKVQRSNDVNYDLINNLWQTIYLNERKTIEQEELYSSNWFPITELPTFLHFHKFSSSVPYKFQMWKCKYPASKYKEYFATFAGCYDFMEVLPKTETYNPRDSISVSISEILSGEYDTSFIDNNTAKNTLVYLLNLAFKSHFKNLGLRHYTLASKRNAYWFQKDSLEKNKANGILMVGKMKYGKEKRINWHFAISGDARVSPEIYFVLKSHIVFTWDGALLIPQDSIQHKGRRKQGKGWWNKQWREKLLAFISVIGDDENKIIIQVGEQDYMSFSTLPLLFQSPVSYLDPLDENLPDDHDLGNSESDNDEIIEIEVDDE
jgi:hypothetical protein